jgi:hypothetical protein
MTALLVGASASLLVGHHPIVVTSAQVVLVVVSVAVGIFVTRLLHDAIPSDVRSGVASGIGALTWVTFLPFALGFGAASERWGVHVAGWLVVGVAAAVAGLLIVVVTARSTRRAPATYVLAAVDITGRAAG